MIRIFEVGGMVRDNLMGLKPKDNDYAIEAESWDQMREHILGLGGKIFLETPKYFTMRAHIPGIGAADFSLTRKDGTYTDGRRPDSVSIGTIEEDLARRDFTCNAMARDVATDELLDLFDGRKHIEDQMLVAVGSPAARFDEDRLRPFRAVRFAVEKRFRIHGDVWNAINRMTQGQFDAVATERIRVELTKSLQANTERTFDLLRKDFPVLWDVITERGFWFKPTIETK